MILVPPPWEWLMLKGPNPYTCNTEGESAIQLALNRENRELVSIMVLKITCILLTVTFKEKQFDNIHKSWNW